MEAVPGAHRGKVKKGLEPDHLEKGGQLSEHGLEIAWPQDALLRGKQDEKPYCLTGECSPDFKRCLAALVPVAS